MMKKPILTLLGVLMLNTPVFADLSDFSTTTQPDIIRTTYGDFNAYGLPVTHENDMDFQIVTKLAEQGNHNAQFHLAKIYDLGIHTNQNPEKAIHWYRKSAENGNASAMNNLAVRLAKHPSADFTPEGVVLLQKASEQHQPHAMTNLAIFWMDAYLSDEADKKTYDDGMALLIKAGETGFAPAYYHLSYYYGKDMMKLDNMDEKDKDEIDRQRFYYLKKSAEMGFATAQMALSDYYHMNGVMSPYHEVRPIGIAMTYQWAKRACTNGIERGCQTAKLFDEYKNMDFDLAKMEMDCNKGNDDACQSHALLKSTQDMMRTVDESNQNPY